MISKGDDLQGQQASSAASQRGEGSLAGLRGVMTTVAGPSEEAAGVPLSDGVSMLKRPLTSENLAALTRSISLRRPSTQA